MLRAVIFDWAGTAVDFGSLAPVAAFAAAFERAHVPVSVQEIRRPMGLEKRRHIATMLSDATIAARWERARGTAPTERDVDELYHAFDEQLAEILPRFAEPVPGLTGVLATLRANGVRIGSNTGYSSRMMKTFAPAARAQGFDPDCTVCPDQVAASRPAPDLSWRALELLGLDRECAAVKVDDTCAGIEEGRNAGLTTVAVAISGNEVGLSLDDWNALDTRKQGELRERAHARLRVAKPDHIIDSVADLLAVI
jgi:phosphonoacetaldehyde hydrolase